MTAASLAALKLLSSENVLTHCREMGQHFKHRLLRLKDRHSSVTDVRGEGLMLGMEIEKDGDAVVKTCMEKGFLINCIQGRILRFVPPVIITKEAIDALADCLDDIL